MKRKLSALIISVTLVASTLFTACKGPEKSTEETGLLEETTEASEGPIGFSLENLTIEQKVCQMIMPCFRTWSDTPKDEGSYANVEVLNEKQTAFLTEYNFGGLCLFAQNCSGTEQLAKLTSQIQEAANASESKLPMLLSIDQEGGYITRLATGTSGVGNMALAATGNTKNAVTMGEIIGSELSALGVNVNFGPDTDVNNNPDNPIIGIRSFSDDPETVSAYGAAYIEGLHKEGIISCVKHFPGHGDTNTDSHVGFPYIDKNLDELKKMELIPFQQLADTTDIVMTAHIQYPQIENNTYKSISTGEEVFLPATMSRTIITDVLRNELGYDGVVSTDALDMGAITENFDILDAAKMAINADVDILLMPVEIKNEQGIDNMKAFVKAIVEMIENGEIAEAEIDDSVKRILTLKEKYNLLDRSLEPVEEKASKALSVVGSKEHHDTEWDIALEAVTLYKDSDAVDEITDESKILYICPWDSNLNSFEFAKQKLISEGKISEDMQTVCKSYDGIESDISSQYATAIEKADVIILVSRCSAKETLDITKKENVNARFCAGILAIANKKGKQTVLISSQLPYDATAFDAQKVYLVYCPTGISEIPTAYNGEVKKYVPNLAAAVYEILSNEKPSGSCPIKLQD